MFIYITMLTISMLFCYISTKCKDSIFKKLMAFLSFIPFFLISAIRYDVGTDYLFRYVPSFNIIKSGYDVPSLEFGFKCLVKLCLLISKEPYFMFSLLSFIVYSLLFRLIYKYSKNPLLSIFLFFGLGRFFESLNIVRQYIAILLMLTGFFEYKEGHKKIFWLFLVLAFEFHNSAIIGVIFPLLFELSKKKIKVPISVSIIMSLIIVVFHSYFLSIIYKIIELTRFSGYINSTYNVSDFKYIVFIIQFLILIIFFFIYYKKSNDEKTNKDELDDFLYFNIQSICLIFCSFSAVFQLFSRMTYYLAVFNIFSVPHFLEKTKVRKKLSKDYLLFAFIIIMTCSFNIIYSNILNNYNEVIPYKTIYNFEK